MARKSSFLLKANLFCSWSNLFETWLTLIEIDFLIQIILNQEITLFPRPSPCVKKNSSFSALKMSLVSTKFYVHKSSHHHPLVELRSLVNAALKKYFWIIQNTLETTLLLRITNNNVNSPAGLPYHTFYFFILRNRWRNFHKTKNSVQRTHYLHNVNVTAILR